MNKQETEDCRLHHFKSFHCLESQIQVGEHISQLFRCLLSSLALLFLPSELFSRVFHTFFFHFPGKLNFCGEENASGIFASSKYCRTHSDIVRMSDVYFCCSLNEFTSDDNVDNRFSHCKRVFVFSTSEGQWSTWNGNV